MPYIDDENVFFGIEASLHVGIGGHIKVGWDTNTSITDALYTIGPNPLSFKFIK